MTTRPLGWTCNNDGAEFAFDQRPRVRLTARARARSDRARIGRARPCQRPLLQRRVRDAAPRRGSGGVAALGKFSFGLVVLQLRVRYLIAGHR